jgi:hypothetical protein
LCIKYLAIHGEEDKKNPLNPKDNEDIKYTPEMMSGLMLLAKKANEQEKDKTKKEENDAMLNMLAACSYDKDGNEEYKLDANLAIMGDCSREIKGLNKKESLIELIRLINIHLPHTHGIIQKFCCQVLNFF